MKKQNRKIIKLFLIFFMVFTVQPAIAFAKILEEYNPNRFENEIIKNEEVINEVKTIGELEDKRESNVKQYLNSDGTITAAIYNEDIHYLKNGKYYNIDNSLIDQKNIIKNKENNFVIEYGKNKNSDLVKIIKDDYVISWSLNNIKEQEVKIYDLQDINPVYNNDKPLIKESNYQNTSKENQEEMLLENISSAVKYESVLPSVDLEYILIGSKVKENIILNKAYFEPISFTLSMKNLIPVLNNDNTISLLDGKVETFKFASLFMYDKKGELSTKIDIKLDKIEEEYILTIKPDENWLKDEKRAYPVIIDPTLHTQQSITGIQDTYLWPNDGNTTSPSFNEPFIRVGSNNNAAIYTSSNPYQGLVKFPLPLLESADQIISAEMALYSEQSGNYSYTPPSSPIYIDVHEVTSYWESANARWNNITYNLRVSNYFIYNYNVNNAWYTVDITDIAKNWYTTGNNNGVLLKENQEVYQNRGSARFISSDVMGSYSGARPIAVINYLNQTGLLDYQTYQNIDMKRSGTIYTNSYNGNAILIHHDLTTTGSKFPITLKHIFNNNDSSSTLGYGKGFRLNFNQIMTYTTIGGTSYIKYIDEDATRHYFRQISGVWQDEEGMGLKITESSNALILLDKDGNKSIFTLSNNIFYLTKMIDNDNNEVNISYVSGNYNLISIIVDGNGNVITLNYDNNNHLSSIINHLNKTISFTYDNNNLTKITYPDNKYSIYSYEEHGKLEIVKNIDDYHVKLD